MLVDQQGGEVMYSSQYVQTRYLNNSYTCLVFVYCHEDEQTNTLTSSQANGERYIRKSLELVYTCFSLESTTLA